MEVLHQIAHFRDGLVRAHIARRAHAFGKIQPELRVWH